MQFLRVVSRLLGRKKKRKIFEARGLEGNTVDTGGAKSLKGLIEIARGSGNLVKIAEGSEFAGSIKVYGTGNRVLIGEGTKIQASILVKGSNQTVSIGDFTTIAGAYILCQEGCHVSIGRWCMFSRDIEIRTTDAHSVVDRKTGQRLNTPASISIGDHVWVGVRALISKGAKVPSDSIIGAMSFVNSSFEEDGVIVAGVPAKIIRRGITWNRSRKRRYSEAEMTHWRE